MSPEDNIIEISAKKLENGWFVEIVRQVAYDAVRTKGYVFKDYTEMLEYFEWIRRKEV